MFSRLSATLFRPTAVRTSAIRKIGGGPTPYEKVIFSRDSLCNPKHALEDKGLLVVAVVTGLGVVCAVAFPVYYLCTNFHLTLNKSRPHAWLDDVRPGHKSALFGKKKFGDMHDDIKNIRNLLGNPNNENVMNYKDFKVKVREPNALTPVE